MNAVNNFNSIAAEVIASATSDKARAFAEKVVASIAARGESWIEKNAAALSVTLSADQLRDAAPVADNRLFFLKKWQLV